MDRCTVCGIALEEPKSFQGRDYCDEHFERFSEEAPGVWRATTLTIVVLVVQVIGLVVLSTLLPAEGRIGQAAGAAIVGVPALLWLAIVVRAQMQEFGRVSPLLPTTFLLAALVVVAVAVPFLEGIIDLETWLTRTTPINRFMGNVLVGGFTHMLLLFIVVRFTVWVSPQFERRSDGILYSVAAGMGYAVAINGLFLLEQPGLTVLNGGFRLITTFCPFVIGSIVLGYFLGRNRFEELPFFFLAAGVAVSAGLYGLARYAGVELNSIRLNLTTDGFSPWPGLVFNLIVLTITAAAVAGLQGRINRLTRARLGLETSP